MPQIRHIGITTNDPVATGEFYKDAFGFVEVSRDPNNEGMIISDGYINVTLLKFKYDRYGGGEPGLHHFGVQVEDLDHTEQKIAAVRKKIKLLFLIFLLLIVLCFICTLYLLS